MKSENESSVCCDDTGVPMNVSEGTTKGQGVLWKLGCRN